MTLNPSEQFFILNKFRHDLMTTKKNTIETNRKNFQLMNRLFKSFETKKQVDKKVVVPKTPYEEALGNVQKLRSLKQVDKTKKVLEENKQLFYKLFARRQTNTRNENAIAHWKKHCLMKKKLLEVKQRERDACNRAVALRNERDAQLLEKYITKVNKIRHRRNVEIQKEDFKHARGVTCADFTSNIMQELQEFNLQDSNTEMAEEENSIMDVKYFTEDLDTTSFTQSSKLPEKTSHKVDKPEENVPQKDKEVRKKKKRKTDDGSFVQVKSMFRRKSQDTSSSSSTDTDRERSPLNDFCRRDVCHQCISTSTSSETLQANRRIENYFQKQKKEILNTLQELRFLSLEEENKKNG